MTERANEECRHPGIGISASRPRTSRRLASARGTPAGHAACPARSWLVARALALAAHLWRGAVGAAEQSHTQSGSGRALQHRSPQCGRWPCGLPQDYAGIPRDVPRLGRHCRAISAVPSSRHKANQDRLRLDPEQQRVNQETEAARTSKVFASTNVRPSAAATASRRRPPNAASSSDEAFAQNGQDRKLAFVNASVDRRTTSPDRVSEPASPFVVQAGTVIPAALITGIRSDLPGQITAQVTENVYDTPTGRALLIPQGARLIGIYDSQVAFGQSRVLLVWTRLIMPNGRSIVLERQPGADTAGYAGLEDEVDNHWGALFKAALLSTLLGVGSRTWSGTGSNDSAIHSGASPRAQGFPEPDRAAGRSAQSQHPADPDDPAGFPGARDRQPRPRA